jgi:hypothetical protein
MQSKNPGSETMKTTMLDGVVPTLDEVPEDMRAELVEMAWWDVQMA